jgi:signal peptidase I
MKHPKRSKSNWKRRLALIGFGVLLLVSGYLQPYRPVIFVGNSMEPTFKNGQLAWIAPTQNLAVGDVVLIQTETGQMVKRIYLGPGDLRTEMQVSGRWVGLDGTGARRLNRPGLRYRYLRLASDEFFVLGDNLDESNDSRNLGTIRRTQILGKVTRGTPSPFPRRAGLFDPDVTVINALREQFTARGERQLAISQR